MLIDFFEFARELKKIPRQGWVDKLKLDAPESVAEHSFSVAILSMVLADQMKLNSNKVLKMALLHDLAESITGDIMPNQMSKTKKNTKENNAMKTILEKLPLELSSEYTKLWNEFLSNKTKEAKLVHDLDKLEMVLQARYYNKQGHSKKSLSSFTRTAKKEIKNPKIKLLMNKLLDDIQ